MTSPRQLIKAVAEWPVASQQRSRRNALVAGTALAQRRRERQDVETFLAAHQSRYDARTARTANLA